jgi:hypothetical protein
MTSENESEKFSRTKLLENYRAAEAAFDSHFALCSRCSSGWMDGELCSVGIELINHSADTWFAVKKEVYEIQKHERA